MILAVGVEVWPQLETPRFLVIAERTPRLEPVSLADWDSILRQYLEQLDSKFAPLFGGESLAQTQPPLGQKPILLICADKASYLKRLGEYGVANPAAAAGSGGYYHPDANIIITWRQPTDYYSRHVVLHEVAHWYCLQQLGPRYTKLPLWLCEGMADFAAFHVWDGQTLRAMHMPQVSLENYPARLDSLFKRLPCDETHGEISPESVMQYFELLRTEHDSDNPVVPYDEYALAWGLVAYLVDGFPREMTRFFDAIRQVNTSESWQSAFGETNGDLKCPTWPRFVEWIGSHQLPWQWIWNYWEDTGSQLVGISDSTALIVRNGGPYATILRCKVTPLLDGTTVGLVFRYENSEQFEMLQFRETGKDAAVWRHVRFAQKKREALSRWQKIAKTEGTRLEIEAEPSPQGQKFRFSCNDRLITVISAGDTDAGTEGRLPFGLAVQSGAAQFHVETAP